MSDPISQLVQLLARLPGVGERTASRLAYFVLGADAEYAEALGHALATLHARVRRCDQCGNYATESRCVICNDPRRDPRVVCVVARPPDLTAIERGGAFSGRYFVLHGLLSPLEGTGPEDLPLSQLQSWVEREPIEELIVATPLSVEGEATALLLAETMRSAGVRCSRIASGLPHGGELEYTDQVTLARALEGRKVL